MGIKYLIKVHQLTRTMVSPTCLLFGQQSGPPPPPPWVFVTAHPSLLLFILSSTSMRLLSVLPLIEGCYRSTMIVYFYQLLSLSCLPVKTTTR